MHGEDGPSAACRSESGFLETSEYVVELLLYFKLGLACHARPSVAFTGTEERLSGQTAQRIKWAAFTLCKGNGKIACARGRVVAAWCSTSLLRFQLRAKCVMAVLDESE